MSEDGVERDGLRRGDLVVVTGGGGGFGRAIARRFASCGARIAVWDVHEPNGEETVRLAAAEGVEARFFPVDLAHSAAVRAAAEATLAWDVPYCVINNASFYARASVCDLDEAAWERTLKVNLTAPFLVAQAIGPQMIARGRGAIINIASGRALQGAVNGVAYACSKAAILSLTKTLALEWARHNIRVNAIIPGVSLTAMPLENASAEELIARGQRSIPLGRIGYPEDVAGLAAFLASPDAAFMTGQGVAVNGGAIMIP